jgi:5-(carboxyamino)imidazole ribonucleotide synthase
MVKIGVVGGGQLARMMIPAAINLGVDITVFSEAEGSSAKLATSHVGDYTKLDELSEFSFDVDVLTFDHEHVPLALLNALIERGVNVSPPPSVLALVQNKIVMRKALASLGLPQPRWAEVTTESELLAAVDSIGGFPCIAKLPVGGYDGKGVRVVTGVDDLTDWLTEGPVLLEEKVDFHRELSQVGARNSSGDWVAWPVVETRQSHGVCSEVIAPAPRLSATQMANAEAIGHRIAEQVGVIGVLAVELFEDTEGRLLINELAMRPHNSGHVFTELSVTSQFEQHLRAVSNIPLGSTALIAETGIMVNLFGGVDADLSAKAWTKYPEAKIHSYQKQPRSGRKAGHVVVVGSAWAELLETGVAVRDILSERDYDG